MINVRSLIKLFMAASISLSGTTLKAQTSGDDAKASRKNISVVASAKIVSAFSMKNDSYAFANDAQNHTQVQKSHSNCPNADFFINCKLIIMELQ